VQRTRAWLNKSKIPYCEIDIERDAVARDRVLKWTGFLSCPTLVVAEGDSFDPYAEPAPLPAGASPRDVDRGTMITEPSVLTLENFLRQHGFEE
jgi:hypothetical protein